MKLDGYIWERCYECGETKYLPESNRKGLVDGGTAIFCRGCYVDQFAPSAVD